MINLLLRNNFYPVISYRRVQKKKKGKNDCVRFGHSLWSAQPVAKASFPRKSSLNNLSGMLELHNRHEDLYSTGEDKRT